MIIRKITLLSVVVVAGFGVVPVASAASAAPVATQLTLTIATGESPTPVVRRAVLRCNPAGGSHPRPVAACAALRKVDGNLAKLNVTGGVCTMEYVPRTVTATGTWSGRQVRFQHTYGNPCVMRNQAGPVFRF
jgi:hypothetical protein